MPSSVAHFDKYKSNKLLLDSDEMNINTTVHFDWIGTISFYSVLHLVQKTMDESENISPPDDQPQNHHECMNIVKKYSEFEGIRSTYKSLQTMAWVARYSENHLMKEEAIKALEKLRKIENKLLIS